MQFTCGSLTYTPLTLPLQANPWGVTTQIDLSKSSGFLEARKFRLSVGELTPPLLTDNLTFLSLGGNKQVNIETKVPHKSPHLTKT